MTVLPIIDYGDIIYRSASKILLHKLDVIYHTCIRFVTSAPFNTHHCNLYSLVNWPSLHSRRLLHWYHFIYKTIIGKTPHYLSSVLTILTNTRNLRSSDFITMVIPRVRTSLGRSSFHFAAPNDWNKLQKTLRLHTLIPLAAFKSSLRDVVSDECTCF